MHEETVLCCNTLKGPVNVLLKEDHVGEHVKVKHLVVSIKILVLTQLGVCTDECMRVESEVDFQWHQGERNESLVRLHYTNEPRVDGNHKLNVTIAVLGNLHGLACYLNVAIDNAHVVVAIVEPVVLYPRVVLL